MSVLHAVRAFKHNKHLHDAKKMSTQAKIYSKDVVSNIHSDIKSDKEMTKKRAMIQYSRRQMLIIMASSFALN